MGDELGGPSARPTLSADLLRREGAAPARDGVLDLAKLGERAAFGVMLLQWPWETFVTFTFERRVGPVKAQREVRLWLRWVEYQHRAIGWMFGLEQDDGADRVHAHGLVVGGRGVLWEPLWRAWRLRNGAMRTEPPRSGAAVSLYCTKYAGKRGEVFFSEGLERFRTLDLVGAGAVRPEEPASGRLL